jgi:hypothetical protein
MRVLSLPWGKASGHHRIDIADLGGEIVATVRFGQAVKIEE